MSKMNDKTHLNSHLLRDQVAVVTGGARGIGGATATLMASVGAKVVIGDILAERGKETVAEIEKLMGSLAIPPRSAALHDLWRRLLIARSAEPSGGKTATHFLSLRLAALYKSGLLKDLEAATGSPPPALVPIAGNGNGAKDGVAPADDLVLAVQRAKAQLGHGQREAACASARSASGPLMVSRIM